MYLYYQVHEQGAPAFDHEKTPTSPVLPYTDAAPYPSDEIVDYFVNLNMTSPSFNGHCQLARNSPHPEPPRSLPLGSHQYMASQMPVPVPGAATEQWSGPSGPASTASDCDSFSYQGSPVPAHAWITPGISPGSSSVPSPRGCWSSTNQDTSYPPPSSWPAGQHPLPPSYDMNLHMHPHDFENVHPLLKTAGSRVGTPALHTQSQAPTQGSYIKEKFEDDDDEADVDDNAYNDNGNSNNAEIEEDDESNRCYAIYLREALLSTPRHAMTLKDIYDWFKRNTNKPNPDPTKKGWTNSVRHNLSMNEHFVRRSRAPFATESQTKKVIWEWCLDHDKDFRSTTYWRGRDKDGNMKPGHMHKAQPSKRVANRAAGGREGGLSAGRSKIAKKRSQQSQRKLASQEHHGMSLSQYSESFSDYQQQYAHQRSTSYPATGYGMAVGENAGYPYTLQQQQVYEQLQAHPSPSSIYSMPAMESIYPPMPVPGSGVELVDQHVGHMYHWPEQGVPNPYHA